ncbi:MAG TPA: hypothetical protein VJP84_00725 [Steroidobacteraceae bacterium]|nr:hypothetical protein [Steroidobacteraceae bacterium]
MKLLAALVTCALAALAFATSATARPLVIEDTAVIENPDPVRYRSFGFDAATNGEWAFVGAADTITDYEVEQYYVLLYRRVNGQWTLQRELVHVENYDSSYSYPVELAMDGNFAVVGVNGSAYEYHLVGDTWTQGQQLLGEPSYVIRMNGGRALLSNHRGWGANVAERDASGTWTTTLLQGQPHCCDDEFWGGPLAILGNRAILGTPYTYDDEPQEIPIYQRTAPNTWSLYTKLQVPVGAPGLGAEVGLSGDAAIVDGFGGAYVWRTSLYGQPDGRIQAIDSAMVSTRNNAIEGTASLVFYRTDSVDLGGAIHVFRADAQGQYREIATLVARNGGTLGQDLSIAGNTVMVSSSQRVLVFKLPATITAPTPRYENFENGAGSWTPGAGAQFAVIGNAANHVYRQSSLVGDARALLNNSWTHQAIEADMRPLEFSGDDRWFGLTTRYRDAQNFFYVTLRSSGTVQLRRVHNGVVSERARAPLTVTTNRTYRVRLESWGHTHRVYVDGQLLLDVDVAGAVEAGSSGIAMYRTRADIDNVVVSPSPRGTIYRSDFASSTADAWSQTGTGQWSVRSGVLAQDSIGGDARAAIGPPTDDQVIEARVRPMAYAAPSGTQERWVGVFARFKDPQNFYYLSLRSGNTVSLRKVVNGAITTLASAPFTVAVNTPYRVRLETVGTQLRAFVGGYLKLQASDASIAEGTGGVVTFKAAATFDDYNAYQP